MDGLMPIHLLSAVLVGKGSLGTQAVLSVKRFHNYDKLHWLVVRMHGKFMLLWLQYVCTSKCMWWNVISYWIFQWMLNLCL